MTDSGGGAHGVELQLAADGADEEVSYLPIVEFTDSRGNPHRFTSVGGGSSRTPVV
jgi:hypothetical protein